jgi:tRNA (guanosine-2'-O-)-methyltransferase
LELRGPVGPFSFLYPMETEDLVLKELYDIITENKREMFDRIAADRTRHITVVLENIYQEHNASAVLRSCDCFGVQELHVIEKDNTYKVQREIARGAGRWTDLYNYSSNEPTKECIQHLKNRGYKIIATTPHTRNNTINDLPLDTPMAFVFGTERRGISQEVIDLADDFVTIPMYGFTESFNISVSVAIVLNTIRERLENSELNWKLSFEQQRELKMQWCRSILNGGQALEDEIRRRLFKKE